MKNLIFIICTFVWGVTLAQPGNTINGNARSLISYAMLPDSNYTFAQILSGTNFAFIAGDSLYPSKHAVYWLKITIANPQHYSGYYRLAVEPNVYNAFYYYDANMRQWRTQKAGIRSGVSTERDENGVSQLLMQPFITNTVYVKMDIAEFKNIRFSIKPHLHAEEQTTADNREENFRTGWAASMAVMFFFFLSNVYLYIGFRDRPVFYYLVVQIGAMVYITTYRRLLPFTIFTADIDANGSISYYTVNTLLMHIGIVLTLYGFVQLTRMYLNTQKHMPRWDAALQYGLYFYCAAVAVLTTINVTWFLAENYTLVGENIYIFLLISIIMYVCVLGYRRRLPASGAFLVANALPLTIIISITLFHVFINSDESANWWLPNLGLVSAAFVFSIALVARTKLIEKHLAAKELEARELAFELGKIALRQESLELENQKISISIENEKNRNEFLQQKLEANQRELASTTLYMVQKNELLSRLKTEIVELNNTSPDKNRSELSGIKSILRSNSYIDDDWAKFKMHFEQVHPNFFENLQANYPALTKNDIRLYAYFHINLSTKEIATLLNITPASVRQAKMRLYKKMGRTDLAGGDGDDTDG